MKCKYCNRNLDEHNVQELEKCLNGAFGISLPEAGKVLEQENLVESVDSSSESGLMVLYLKDELGTMETYRDSLDETHAYLLLAFCYIRPDEGVVTVDEPA